MSRSKSEPIRKKRPITARAAAEAYGVSIRTVQSWVAMRRQDWIDEQAATREAIRAYHDDDGHSWSETAEHFGMSVSAVRQRAYRAREERAAEADARQRRAMVPPPLPPRPVMVAPGGVLPPPPPAGV